MAWLHSCLSLVVFFSVLMEDASATCSIRKNRYTRLNCYHGEGILLNCAALEAELRRCNIHLCNRDPGRPNVETCVTSTQSCPAGSILETNAVCGRGENCCTSMATSCESPRPVGVVNYSVNHALGFRAYCDGQADGGGWTVIQRRTSGSTNFDRNWADYENGFGAIENGYWLGLRNTRALIERGEHEVRFEFVTSRGVSEVVQYNRFSIGPAWDRYRLSISALNYNFAVSTETGLSIELHNLMRFTTRDRDHDNCLTCNCAVPGKGGWWYHSCSTANLNGRWNFPRLNWGVSWIFNAGLNRPLRETRMMIRQRGVS